MRIGAWFMMFIGLERATFIHTWGGDDPSYSGVGCPLSYGCGRCTCVLTDSLALARCHWATLSGTSPIPIPVQGGLMPGAASGLLRFALGAAEKVGR